ncbi:MAG: protein YgfX [Pontibacterium sp.]
MSELYWIVFSPLEVQLRPSLRLAAIVFGSHLLAIVALFVADIEPFTASFLAILLFLSMGWQSYHRVFMSNPDAICVLRWNADFHEISVQMRSGRWQRVDVLMASVVLPYALVLRVELENYALSQSVIIFPDAVKGPDFRRLRVLALHGAYVNQVNPTDSLPG